MLCFISLFFSLPLSHPYGQMSEEQAFEMIKYLLFHVGLRKQYTPDMSALQVRIFQLVFSSFLCLSQKARQVVIQSCNFIFFPSHYYPSFQIRHTKRRHITHTHIKHAATNLTRTIIRERIASFKVEEREVIEEETIPQCFECDSVVLPLLF